MIDRAAIQGLIEAWQGTETDCASCRHTMHPGDCEATEEENFPCGCNNPVEHPLIVAARESIPALLDELSEVEASRNTWKRWTAEKDLALAQAEARLAAATEAAGRLRWKVAVVSIHNVVVKQWSAWSWEDRRFLALALAGEVGEAANLVKKQWRGDAAPIEEKLAEELGDIRIYLELLAHAFGVDLDSVCDRIIRDKLLSRWPEARAAVDAALAVPAEAPAQEPGREGPAG